jgi:uncharacterized Zn finger protein
MEEPSWTGVILAYICPTCGKEDQQRFIFEGATYDKAVLSKAAAHMMPCRKCGTPIPKNLLLETDIVVAPLDALRKAGYPAPQVN